MYINPAESAKCLSTFVFKDTEPIVVEVFVATSTPVIVIIPVTPPCSSASNARLLLL